MNVIPSCFPKNKQPSSSDFMLFCIPKDLRLSVSAIKGKVKYSTVVLEIELILEAESLNFYSHTRDIRQPRLSRTSPVPYLFSPKISNSSTGTRGSFQNP